MGGDAEIAKSDSTVDDDAAGLGRVEVEGEGIGESSASAMLAGEEYLARPIKTTIL